MRDRSPLWEKLRSLRADPGSVLAVAVLAYLSLVLFFELARSFSQEPHGDVKLYHRTIQAISQGKMPYRDFEFEYPPYALLWFIGPGMIRDVQGFKLAFGAEMLGLDTVVKVALVWLAWNVGQARRLFWPVCLFAAATAFNHFFYLQRFDLIPATITLAMLLAFSGERHVLAGVLLAFGVGCKLDPILFVPPLTILAWRRGKAGAFLAGVGLGLFPLVLIAPVMPWWRFLAFHTGRGLQAESLFASVVWLLHHGGLVDATWTFVKAWTEVGGGVADTLVPYARALLLLTVVGSVVFASWRVAVARALTLPRLARLLLIPLTAFVAFNIVLSPQYLVWIATIGAAAAVAGPLKHLVALTLCAVVIPVFYPGTDYGTGLNLLESAVLAGRNLLLIWCWLGLMREELASGEEVEIDPAGGPPAAPLRSRLSAA